MNRLRSLSDEITLRALKQSMHAVAKRLRQVARPLASDTPPGTQAVRLRVLPGGLRARR